MKYLKIGISVEGIAEDYKERAERVISEIMDSVWEINPRAEVAGQTQLKNGKRVIFEL